MIVIYVTIGSQSKKISVTASDWLIELQVKCEWCWQPSHIIAIDFSYCGRTGNSALFSVWDGQIYMTDAIFRPHPNCNHINTNPDYDPVNTNPNPNHNHTPRTENSMKQIELSIPGDEKYHLWRYLPSGMDTYKWQALFSVPGDGK